MEVKKSKVKSVKKDDGSEEEQSVKRDEGSEEE
jgi:hypothetical protein